MGSLISAIIYLGGDAWLREINTDWSINQAEKELTDPGNLAYILKKIREKDSKLYDKLLSKQTVLQFLDTNLYKRGKIIKEFNKVRKDIKKTADRINVVSNAQEKYQEAKAAAQSHIFHGGKDDALHGYERQIGKTLAPFGVMFNPTTNKWDYKGDSYTTDINNNTNSNNNNNNNNYKEGK